MLNVVALQGRLVKDPRIYETLGAFTIAVNLFKGKTLFIDCVVFGSNIDYLAKYGKKGKRILVSGSLDLKSGEEKGAMPENTNRIQIQIVANQISVIDFHAETEEETLVETKPTKTKKTAEEIYQETESDDDLPF